MTGLVADPFCRQHDPGAGDPESPARPDAMLDGFKQAGLSGLLVPIGSREASREDLHVCHASDYLSLAEHEILDGCSELGTGDTHVCEKSWPVALRAAGGVLSAVDAVMTGRVRNAFCVVHPHGGHATSNRGVGFCILNNIAIAARYAQRWHGAGRILIVDWDAHHGNGMEDIFFEDGLVFFFSTHQAPWYPETGARNETGEGDGMGATLNCPLPGGSGGNEVLCAFEEQLLPAAAAFRSDLLRVSAGFDLRAGDPLGDFTLTDGDFAELTRLVPGIARRQAADRVVTVLDGGYNVTGLATATSAHVRTLMHE